MQGISNNAVGGAVQESSATPDIIAVQDSLIMELDLQSNP